MTVHPLTSMRRYVLAVAIAAIAAPAAAQPAPWSPPRMTAGWVFTPAVAFGGLWDSNPTTENEGGDAISELVGLINPRTEIDFNDRRAKFSAGYSGTLERYRELQELTRYRQRGRVEAKYQMTPRLLLDTRHSVTLTPTTDDLELDGVVFARVGSRMVTSLGGFEFDIKPRLELKTNYMFQWVDFDRNAVPGQDFQFLQGGHAHSPSAEVLYALDQRVKVGALYIYRYTVIDAGEEVFDSHRAQGTAQLELGPTTSIHGAAGIDRVGLIDGSDAKSGLSLGAGIVQRIQRASVHGSYERGFNPSFGFGGLTARQTLAAGVTVPLAAGRAFVSGGFSYRRSDPIILRDVLVELDSYWTHGAVGYAIARWIRMEGFLAVNQQYSSAQGNVQRTRVGIQFVTSKPVRIQ